MAGAVRPRVPGPPRQCAQAAGRPRAPTGSRWVARVAAPLLGAPLALAFPRPALWWLAWVALVPLTWLAALAPDWREGALRGALGGAGFFLAVDSFLLPNVTVFAPLLALALGLTWSLWGALARLLHPPLRGSRLALALVLEPTAWVAGEYVRSWQHLGGPWGLLGASQWNSPTLWPAAVGGVWLVSFLIVLVTTAAAAVLAPGASRALRGNALLVVVLVGLGSFAYGAARPAAPASGTLRVAVVQPGVVHAVEPRLRASETATRRLAGTHPDLVVWGESSLGRDPGANPGDVARLAALARATGAPVLANVDAKRGPGGIYKTSFLVGPHGPAGSYDKLRLVPFGEYIPLRGVLGWVDRVTKAAGEDRRRGHGLVLLPVGRVRIGPLICFESAFPDLSRHLAARGADAIVVQSATTTFQGSWGPDQHASLAAVRAVESGRPVVQAAISGVSAVFDANGRRLAWYPQDWRGAAVVTVPLAGGTTPYVRFGDWLPLGSLALLLLTGALAAAGQETRRWRRVTPQPPGRVAARR